MRVPLLEMLANCAQSQNAAFHTPGHKRGQGSFAAFQELIGDRALRADLPELPELDNLFAPQGAIDEAQKLAAETFGAEQTWFLANGSTCGIIATILATCNPGDKILLPRNVHQSAISGLILSGAVPIFLPPEYDPVLDIAHSVTPKTVETALKQHPDAKAVLVIHPTYFGVCGDLSAIANLTHSFGIPLLVDEAHGAHFAFHPDFPISALSAGADLTVQSTHKTLSALTQASMLHVQGSRIERDRISRALQLVQSTSPNYLLLASLDAARAQMAIEGKALMTRTLELADRARSQIQSVLEFSNCFAVDRTRVTITVSHLGLDGFAADELLQTFGVTAEFPSLQHLTFIVSLGNTEADIDRLIEACDRLPVSEPITPLSGKIEQSFSVPSLSPREAFFAASHLVPLEQAIDQISAELICPYPPGIPVLLPGERITKNAIAQLQTVLQAGGFISGCSDPTLNRLKIVS
ncbi:aminotransferase class I/II-fold pyridoxal phosphate-dependent enzyme [Leptolyngbya sp. NIES-2104]|uniref:aminotransferase class I/II-fold pyridoxal phosphate-dependent enzyme n=1 Tax=Leptolyngbya sp. NIES-2104 TaxID=1552121 RepID=UPI0006EC44AD|nr:aminotransferase class I/II-fold pyridoxal phosphate-dependent enzyme [Leptolyngbya sp. NIES-2104]GAP97305.1 lysine decarboxylase [Leptolyngbya sp. NIES-2104]